MLDRTNQAALRQTIVLAGMLGIGDNLHQRALVRDLMRSHRVHLQGYYRSMYADLIAQGLEFSRARSIELRIDDEDQNWKPDPVPGRVPTKRATYDRELIKRHGSLIGAMYGSVGMTMPERPDFSLPVPESWRERARNHPLLVGFRAQTKPLLIYRPIVLNEFWKAPARSPDPKAYAEIFRSIRDRFYVVSLAKLAEGKEWIVGDEEFADLKLHKGELQFETMAGLFAEAALVFGNPGFVPVLAQAVGTPSITVFGGNESARETLLPGAHLAPTLCIDIDRPCECHSQTHNCDKRIALPPAIKRVKEFVSKTLAAQARVLIFGTSYADNPDKQRLLEQWCELHGKVNPRADLLLVDSKSPLSLKDGAPRLSVHRFPDNIGHLARGGRDGWGRAFCKGLQAGIDGGYDYVVHIEGDSLFRLSVDAIAREMRDKGIKVASVPVEGTKRKEGGWVETGLMVFDVAYLKESRFIERYDWQKRTAQPTPEAVIFDLLGADLVMMPWRAERGDKGQITPANAGQFDWITHCGQDAIERFMDEMTGSSEPAVKLNFGCGTNKLAGWQNFDAEIDIAKRLPFQDAYADFIFAEHCVEHIDYLDAVKFFMECRRVLKIGGVIRIAVPSLENIFNRADQAYCKFVHERKWAQTPDKRGALQAIIFQHGHRAAWSETLLEISLYAAGFAEMKRCAPGTSARRALVGAEGHGRVIGDHFNGIETAVVEAIRA